MSGHDIVPNEGHEEENQLREFFKFLGEYFEVEQKWDEIQQFGTNHPAATVFLLVTMILCAVPVTLFSMFVIGSLIVSVSGFLFIEGTLVAVASVILIGALLFVSLLAVGISLFLVVSYHLAVQLGQLLKTKGQMPSLSFRGENSFFKCAGKKD